MQPIDYEEGLKLTQTHVCGECGGALTLPWGGAFGIDAHVIMCGQNRAHQGFTKLLSYTQAYDQGKEVPIPIKDNIEKKRRQRMKQELGEERTTALSRYQGVTTLTQEQATMILKSIWPKAPDIEVFKAALLCHQYGLNPLMKHVYLVEYKKWKKGPDGKRVETGESTWVRILGIGATRLIASRQGSYGYVDGPRMMTREEQELIRGEVDENNIWAITLLQDARGNKAPGYGSWPKQEEPYGADKGNTKQNMAMIRSERNAYDRLLPGEMPADIEVMDTQFLPGSEVEEGKPTLAAASAAPSEAPRVPNDLASEAQWGMIFTVIGKIGVTKDELYSGIKTKFALEDPKQLSKAQASIIIDDLKKTQEKLPME